MTLLNTERFKRLAIDPTAAAEQKLQKVLRKKNLNFQSQDTKYYTQQTHHQPGFMIQARYTSYKTIVQLLSYRYNLLSPTLTQHHANLQNI